MAGGALARLVGLVLTLAAGAAAAQAPARSLVPVPRPALPGLVADVRATPQGLVRAPPRPSARGRAQVPPTMVPGDTAGQTRIAIPAVDLAVALALAPPPGAEAPEAPVVRGPPVPVVAGPGPLRPAARPAARPLAPGPAAAPPAAAAAPAAAADPRAVARSLVPLRRTQAARLRFEAAAAATRAPGRQRPAVVPVAQPARPPAEAAAGGLCGVAGLQGRRLPRITSNVAGCGIDEPVSLTHVHGVRLSPAATLHCDTARATARWVREVALPAVGSAGGGLAELRLGSHYACRARNNQRGARISEHGRGRAIDFMGFRLANGETFTVGRDYRSGRWSGVLRRMRAGACGIFTTTLGPGSDRFHSEHLHFDVARHRNGAAYCR